MHSFTAKFETNMTLPSARGDVAFGVYVHVVRPRVPFWTISAVTPLFSRVMSQRELGAESIQSSNREREKHVCLLRLIKLAVTICWVRPKVCWLIEIISSRMENIYDPKTCHASSKNLVKVKILCGFPYMGLPQIMHFNGIFPNKNHPFFPILGNPHLVTSSPSLA